MERRGPRRGHAQSHRVRIEGAPARLRVGPPSPERGTVRWTSRATDQARRWRAVVTARSGEGRCCRRRRRIFAAWPIAHHELDDYYRLVLGDLPFSAATDKLARDFPLHRDRAEPLELSPAIRAFLKSLDDSRYFEGRDDVAYGQARLAVYAKPITRCSWMCVLQDAASGCVSAIASSTISSG